MTLPPSGGPTLESLFTIFRPIERLPAHELIPADQVPPPYHDLLVHEQHMTVTVEAYHGDLVDVDILERVHEGDIYARKILLTLQKTGRVVQYGIARVDLSACSPEVQAEIVAGQKPFGRILIEHNVHRRVEPTAYLRMSPGPEMMGWFGLDSPRTVYGRLALIHYNGEPAVELLEVVAPE